MDRSVRPEPSQAHKCREGGATLMRAVRHICFRDIQLDVLPDRVLTWPTTCHAIYVKARPISLELLARVHFIVVVLVICRSIKHQPEMRRRLCGDAGSYSYVHQSFCCSLQWLDIWTVAARAEWVRQSARAPKAERSSTSIALGPGAGFDQRLVVQWPAANKLSTPGYVKADQRAGYRYLWKWTQCEVFRYICPPSIMRTE